MKHAPRLSLPAEDATFRAFDTIVDTRSPAEFAEDHVPGAVSCPVLDNEERARVGTIYKQVSPFDAKKLGAALVAKNIAFHLENSFLGKPKTWRPLVYCWRGGKRSGAMAHVLREVGWDAKTLEGGYKAYRRYVVDALAALPEKFTFKVIHGVTGSGKSRLLRALAATGAQALDLEELAAHRGSVLGGLTERPQPSQKMFESLLLQRLLLNFDACKAVFVEGESKEDRPAAGPRRAHRAHARERMPAAAGRDRHARGAADGRVPAFLQRPAGAGRAARLPGRPARPGAGRRNGRRSPPRANGPRWWRGCWKTTTTPPTGARPRTTSRASARRRSCASNQRTMRLSRSWPA